MADVVGQESVKWWLAIAAAGRHNILPVGPHGQGKSMLARAIHGMLPELSPAEYREVAGVYRIAGQPVRGRPFQSVTSDSPASAILGGGTTAVSPGAVSLATCGVLHVDEFLELSRAKVEKLRTVMEERVVSVVRTQFKTVLAADFQLVGTANRCPCGALGHPTVACLCTPSQRRTYASKLSHAMADRIDLIVPIDVLDSARSMRERSAPRPTTAQYQRWVGAAWAAQFARWGPGRWNSTVPGQCLLDMRLTPEVEHLASTEPRAQPPELGPGSAGRADDL
jgi:magnesium chelatase family protein